MTRIWGNNRKTSMLTFNPGSFDQSTQYYTAYSKIGRSVESRLPILLLVDVVLLRRVLDRPPAPHFCPSPAHDRLFFLKFPMLGLGSSAPRRSQAQPQPRKQTIRPLGVRISICYFGITTYPL